MVEWLKLSAVTANCKVSGSSPTIRPDVVYTASFRRDVKLSIPGYWLAFSCYWVHLVSHFTWWFSHGEKSVTAFTIRLRHHLPYLNSL